jgi:hypothetical protein
VAAEGEEIDNRPITPAPQKIAVTVDWKGKTFRNSHRYSDFKLFNVATEERRKTTVPPSPAPENPN